MKKDLLLIGGGGHCRSVIDVIENTEMYKIIGIVDLKENLGKKVLNYTIIGTDEDLVKLKKTIKYAFITIGHIYSNEKRIQIFNILKELNFILPVVVSPLSYVSKYSQIGEGSIIMHHALINANARIGKNCIVNTKALIEHDAVIGDNVHIATAAIINGGVVVKDNSFVGSNCTTKQNIVIEGFNKAGSILK